MLDLKPPVAKSSLEIWIGRGHGDRVLQRLFKGCAENNVPTSGLVSSWRVPQEIDILASVHSPAAQLRSEMCNIRQSFVSQVWADSNFHVSRVKPISALKSPLNSVQQLIAHLWGFQRSECATQGKCSKSLIFDGSVLSTKTFRWGTLFFHLRIFHSRLKNVIADPLTIKHFNYAIFDIGYIRLWWMQSESLLWRATQSLCQPLWIIADYLLLSDTFLQCYISQLLWKRRWGEKKTTSTLNVCASSMRCRVEKPTSRTKGLCWKLIQSFSRPDSQIDPSSVWLLFQLCSRNYFRLSVWVCLLRGPVSASQFGVTWYDFSLHTWAHLSQVLTLLKIFLGFGTPKQLQRCRNVVFLFVGMWSSIQLWITELLSSACWWCLLECALWLFLVKIFIYMTMLCLRSRFMWQVYILSVISTIPEVMILHLAIQLNSHATRSH